jgi:hypothetical protein
VYRINCGGSATFELRVGEYGGTVFGIGVLADDCGLNVVFAGAQLLRDLRVQVGLRAAIRSGCQLAAVPLVAVLLRGPTLVRPLGARLERLR